MIKNYLIICDGIWVFLPNQLCVFYPSPICLIKILSIENHEIFLINIIWIFLFRGYWMLVAKNCMHVVCMIYKAYIILTIKRQQVFFTLKMKIINRLTSPSYSFFYDACKLQIWVHLTALVCTLSSRPVCLSFNFSPFNNCKKTCTIDKWHLCSNVCCTL